MRRRARHRKRIARCDPGKQELPSFDPDPAIEVAGLAGVAFLRGFPSIEARLRLAA
jgi:hypothetical protein